MAIFSRDDRSKEECPLTWEDEVVEAESAPEKESTFQVDELAGWSQDLTAEVAGRGVVSHTGSVALRALADRTGLTAALSSALARRGFTPVHDRGRVLADTAVMIADGGRVMSDLAVLRDQSELFGSVASDPTLWRTLNEIDALRRDKLAAARARTRRHVWDQIAARHGGIPASVVADRDLGKTVVVRLDGTLVVAHSDKDLASGTDKGSWGHHPLTAWCDNTGENLAVKLTGLLREPVGLDGTTVDQLKTRPKDMRVIVRRERPHPGAQLSLFEEADGWRYQTLRHQHPGRHPRPPGRQARPVGLPGSPPPGAMSSG
jgi:hypothetical protein